MPPTTSYSPFPHRLSPIPIIPDFDPPVRAGRCHIPAAGRGGRIDRDRLYGPSVGEKLYVRR